MVRNNSDATLAYPNVVKNEPFFCDASKQKYSDSFHLKNKLLCYILKRIELPRMKFAHVELFQYKFKQLCYIALTCADKCISLYIFKYLVFFLNTRYLQRYIGLHEFHSIYQPQTCGYLIQLINPYSEILCSNLKSEIYSVKVIRLYNKGKYYRCSSYVQIGLGFS